MEYSGILEAFVRENVKRALAEDIGTGDITTLATVESDAKAQGVILCKQAGVLAGIRVAKEVFLQIDSNLEFEILCEDGARIKKGDELAKIKGVSSSILIAERTALNYLQHLSGIASLTYEFVQAVHGTKAKILDTRKTTPGMRLLEKYAVVAGGGENHRMGLYDMIMIKDNHIVAAGSISKAVNSCLQYQGRLKIELECKTLKQLREALEVNGVDRIMLDNMSIETMRKAVEIVAGTVELEASGGINLSTVKKVADTGVDFISVGALTHSAKALDISLEISAV